MKIEDDLTLTDVIALLYVANSIRTDCLEILTRIRTLLIEPTPRYMMLDKRT